MSEPSERSEQAPYVLVGSYTSAEAPGAPGRGSGVAVFRQDWETGDLTPVGDPDPAVDPSYLALHPDGRHVYAVSEAADGIVWAYDFDTATGALTRVGEERSTHGSAPCHLSVDPSGRWLAVANYGSGTVSVHPLGDDGAVGEAADTAAHTGSGPDASRQEGPHAHLALFAARGTVSGAAVLHVVDLGTDEVVTYHVDTATGALTRASAVSVEPGTGPRHLVHHASGLSFLAGELDTSVTVLRRALDDGAMTVVGRVPGLAGEPAGPGSLDGANYPAAITLSPCQRYLYLSNRGQDVITSYRVAGGDPKATADTPTGGGTPREIRFVRHFLYAANQLSDTVTVFRVDKDSGVPQPTGITVATPSPVCLLPVPVR